MTFLQDGGGNQSSGRLVKLISLFLAGLVALGGFTVLIIQKNSNPDLANYCLLITSAFLTVATGSEIVQKVTGK